MTDGLTLTRAFEGAGIGADAAERIATEIYNVIHNVAIKADIERVEAALKAAIFAVRADLTAVRAEFAHKIDTMVARLMAAVVVAQGVLFAALQHWPPH